MDDRPPRPWAQSPTLDLKRRRRCHDAATRAAFNDHSTGIVGDVSHHRAAIPASAPVLDFPLEGAVRTISVQMGRWVRTARLNQHLSRRHVVIAFADFDRIHFGGGAAAA